MGHCHDTKIELWLPSDILNAATEQAELYQFDDVDSLLIEAITDYLHHRDALPLTKG